MISIIDYNAGNLTSVKRALDSMGIACRITPDPDIIRKSERVIFPGVGNAESAMATLRARGLDNALAEAFAKGTPVMGICLGTQIIMSYSEEGNTECLGLIPGKTKKFKLKDRALKIPHMGWNALTIKKAHPLLKTVKANDELYFVHSFYPQPADNAMVVATTTYEVEFPSAIGYKNLFASQFHPEKSGPVGLQILRNFSTWDPTGC
jgi:imidazole glycerol-phosphate synthase subunit HisH